jgi:Ca2+-binding EF-hand superfamily protein
VSYLVYFNGLWEKFEEIDSSGDRRLTLQEFVEGTRILGMDVTLAEAKCEFADMDMNQHGYVLFDEFCAWCATWQEEQVSRRFPMIPLRNWLFPLTELQRQSRGQ